MYFISVDAKTEKVATYKLNLLRLVGLVTKTLKKMVTTTKKRTLKEENKKQIDDAIFKMHKKDKMKFVGKMNTNIDPLEYQKQLRDEWE